MTIPPSPTPPAGVVIDGHAHPSMKTWFGRRDFSRAHRPPRGFAPTGFRTTAPALRAGEIDVLCSAVYVPERQLLDDCRLFRAARLFLPRLRRAFRDPPSRVALQMMDDVERSLEKANATPGRRFAPCRSPGEVDTALSAGEVAVVHTLEGGHHVDGNLANLDTFAERGVAIITLAHFYDVGLAPPTEGVPKDLFLRKLGCFRHVPEETATLPAFGRDVVTRMFELGIVVDLSHTTPPARRDVLALPNPRGRPVVMTHVGVHALMPDPKNPTDQEIRALADTGGTVGIIFYNYWLTTADHDQTNDSRYIVETVKHLVNIGGEDCVALGSDFDGLTTPPADLRTPAEWPNLREALHRHFTSAQVDKFMGDNLMRVLRTGWRSGSLAKGA